MKVSAVKEKIIFVFLLGIFAVILSVTISNYIAGGKEDSLYSELLSTKKKIKFSKHAAEDYSFADFFLKRSLTDYQRIFLEGEDIFFRSDKKTPELPKAVERVIEAVVEEEEEYSFVGTVDMGDSIIVAIKRSLVDDVLFMKDGGFLDGYKLSIISKQKVSFSKEDEIIELLLNQEDENQYEE